MNTISEDKTREYVDLLESFIESAPDARFVCSRFGTIVGGNEPALNLTGFSRDDFLGQNILTLGILSPDQIERALEVIDSVFAENSTGQIEMIMQRKNGSRFHVEVEMRVVRIDESVFLLGSVRAAARKGDCRAFTLEEAIGVQKYFDLAEIMVVAIDSNGDVTLVNENGCEILGYEEGDIIDRNWFDNFLPEKTREATKRAFSNLMENNIEYKGQNTNLVLTSAGE